MIQQRSSSRLLCGGALVSRSGMGRDVHSLMLSIQHSSADHGITHLPRCPEEWFLRGCRVTYPNHASFRLFTVARRGSCGPTRKLILLHTQPAQRRRYGEVSSCTWFQKPGSFFSESSGGHKRGLVVGQGFINMAI